MDFAPQTPEPTKMAEMADVLASKQLFAKNIFSQP